MVALVSIRDEGGRDVKAKVHGRIHDCFELKGVPEGKEDSVWDENTANFMSGESNQGRDDRNAQRVWRDKCSQFAGENHSSVMRFEDKMLLLSVLNNVSGCGDDDAVSVIGFRSTAIGVMG